MPITKRLSYYLTAVLLLVALILYVMSSNTAMLQIQNLLDISSQVRIGDALITREKNWLVVTSRNERGDQVKLFGIIPQWALFRKLNAPEGQFCSFLVYSDGNVMPLHLSFTEMDPDTMAKSRALLKKCAEGRSGNEFACNLVKVGLWSAMVGVSGTQPSMAFVSIPDLRLSIFVDKANLRLLKNIRILLSRPPQRRA